VALPFNRISLSDIPEPAEPPVPKAPRRSHIALNTLMMPEHANHFGNVHGGVIMKLADEAAAIAAMRHAERPAVTVAMDSMNFKEPVHVGDLLTCDARVSYTHKSSMEVTVQVTSENPISGQVTQTNSAFFVFVALGPDGRPRTVPPVLRETPEDEDHYQAGERRQARRLKAREEEHAFSRRQGQQS
jgi:uncharacterized protein (TIGR00369 family)